MNLISLKTPHPYTGKETCKSVSFRVIRHQLMNVATEGNVTPISILEVPRISNIQDQKLVEQLAETIKVIGDKLDQDTEFNESVYDFGLCLAFSRYQLPSLFSHPVFLISQYV